MRIFGALKAIPVLFVAGLAIWGFLLTIAPEHEGRSGITYAKAFAPAHDADIDFHIWYPSESGGRSVMVGGNGVFHGTPAGRRVPRVPGQHPLVLISHGGGGNAGQFGWIASALAGNGYVVALPNHPGSTSGNASAEAAVRVWERPGDVSAVIDAIEADPQNYAYIDTSRIAALGFSAGGYTAMAIAGARVDPQELTTFCDDGGRGMSDCAFLARGGIDLHAMDLSPAAQDHHDPRIRAAIVIDPGIVETLTPESLAAIDIPMLIVNLGAEETVPRGVYARTAAEAIPGARYTIVPDAIHFSFLAQCKEGGARILADEGEPDPLCDDAGGRDRAAIHAELETLIAGYLDTAFGE